MSQETILVVDDEPEQRKVFKGFLAKEGYTIIEAESCDDGIEKIKQHDIDLALIDMIMPGDSGLHCLKYAKKKHPDMRVIMMSGIIPEDIGKDSTDMGADAFFKKPLHKEELLASVRKLLENK